MTNGVSGRPARYLRAVWRNAVALGPNGSAVNQVIVPGCVLALSLLVLDLSANTKAALGLVLVIAVRATFGCYQTWVEADMLMPRAAKPRLAYAGSGCSDWAITYRGARKTLNVVWISVINDPMARGADSVASAIRATIQFEGPSGGTWRSRTCESRWAPHSERPMSLDCDWAAFSQSIDLGIGEKAVLPVAIRPRPDDHGPQYNVMNARLFGAASVSGDTRLDGSGTPPFDDPTQVTIRFDGTNVNEAFVLNLQIPRYGLSLELKGITRSS